MQIRTIGNFTTKNGFAVGSVEGRCAIQYVEEKDSTRNFSFKCHRVDNDVYAVNSISFHPVYGSFSTAGSDGTFTWWDKDTKQRLKIFPRMNNPISSTAFNHNGTIFAYAVSYDWSKGHEHHNPTSAQNTIFLHAVNDLDVKPKSNPAALGSNALKKPGTR